MTLSRSGVADYSELQHLRSGTLAAYSTDDLEARSPDEISLLKGDRMELIERVNDFRDG